MIPVGGYQCVENPLPYHFDFSFDEAKKVLNEIMIQTGLNLKLSQFASNHTIGINDSKELYDKWFIGYDSSGKYAVNILNNFLNPHEAYFFDKKTNIRIPYSPYTCPPNTFAVTIKMAQSNYKDIFYKEDFKRY